MHQLSAHMDPKIEVSLAPRLVTQTSRALTIARPVP